MHEIPTDEKKKTNNTHNCGIATLIDLNGLKKQNTSNKKNATTKKIGVHKTYFSFVKFDMV